MREKRPYTWLERALWATEENRWEHILLSQLSEAGARGIRTLLEPGCGRESHFITCAAMGEVYKVGFDLDPVSASNPDLSAFVLGDMCRSPFLTGSADVILSRWVIEHLANPKAAAEECWRLLRPGGRLLILLPNLFNPAIIAAKLTPTWLHARLRRLSVGDELADNCPTYYRANTPRYLLKLFESVGFRTEFIRCADQAYGYVRFSRILMPLALLYGRLTDPRPLRWLKAAIVAQFAKPAH